MNRIEGCVFAAMVAALVSQQASGATCASYTRITDAGQNGVFDGIVAGYQDHAGVVRVQFASVTSGEAYTCKEVPSWRFDLLDQADQDRLNDQVRKAAILSMSLGYRFTGEIGTQNGEARLLGAGVSK